MKDPGTYVDAAAAVMGLPIGPYREGVVRYFGIAADMAAVLDAFPLSVHDESAEIYEPIART